MTLQKIKIVNASEHNLKNLNLEIPRNKLVVICGPSGSGKSTLAFDLIYAEGQRRYVESLSAYARQFLPQLDKPRVDKIEGLSPAISIEQHSASRNPRSTVGTSTEIYDFLRVFYARLGVQHCPKCKSAIVPQTIDSIVDEIMELPEKTKVEILSPVVNNQKGTQKSLFMDLMKKGFTRVMVNGEIHNLESPPQLDKTHKHSIEIIIDRLSIKKTVRARLTDSVETAIEFGKGSFILKQDNKTRLFSTDAVCPVHKISMPKLSPQLFSFNSPQGSCPECYGIGSVTLYDRELMVPDKSLSISKGGILPLKYFSSYVMNQLEALLNSFGYTFNTPLSKINKKTIDIIFDGSPGFNWEGIVPILKRGSNLGTSFFDRFSQFKRTVACPKCHGTRLRDEALNVTIEGLSITEFTSMSIAKGLKWVLGLEFEGINRTISEPLLKELVHRIRFLHRVGLDYLSLDREMSTLSGGEAQRIRLAGQLGTGLVGVTYVLDEPSIGLHQRDNERLLSTLRELQERGNTVLVVEHDEQTILSADHIIELGPGSGKLGGEIVFQGSVKSLMRNKKSLTAAYLRKDITISGNSKRRKSTKKISFKGVKTHNLDNISCEIPLECLTCVTGVSGSGKSSLVVDTIYKNIVKSKGLKTDKPGEITSMSGSDLISKIIIIDQSPIGRTPRSNPATYTKIFDEIRDIFASLPESKVRGYKKGRFSFNVKGGRCEKCSGDGEIKVEMHFLPDVYITCDACHGKRYNKETLQIKYKGKSISDVLEMTVRESSEFFKNFPSLQRKIKILQDVGLDYIQLGQSATTLSGGEAQRIKISRELGKRNLPGSLYILDEPTTGLHMHEVGKLIEVLNSLVDKMATIVIIEHNIDVIKACDFVIDLGPGGGEYGGKIVSMGTPEEIAKDERSVTGKFL